MEIGFQLGVRSLQLFNLCTQTTPLFVLEPDELEDDEDPEDDECAVPSSFVWLLLLSAIAESSMANFFVSGVSAIANVVVAGVSAMAKVVSAVSA